MMTDEDQGIKFGVESGIAGETKNIIEDTWNIIDENSDIQGNRENTSNSPKEPEGFALIEDWDGSLIFGHIDEDRHLNDLMVDIGGVNEVVDEDDRDDDEDDDDDDDGDTAHTPTGYTTDEDIPSLPQGVAAIQATQFTPTPTPTPSSPIKEGRKPQMGHFHNPLTGDIHRVAREGVPLARFTNTHNQTNGNSIIIDHKHKPVPSPYSDFYLVGNQRRCTREDSESESPVRSTIPQQPLSLDDVIDTSTLSDTPLEIADSSAHNQHTRWDRIPIGAFSMSQSDFNDKGVNPTHPHLIASARSSKSNSPHNPPKHRKSRPKQPSPLVFPSDGSGQGHYATPQSTRRKGKSREATINQLDI
ncbi:hypothetical protein E3P77_02567 [Wallemia ichthyophaga]|nr:hypothetical protein E3P77_02567 [Wallemia ichthyophaga]